MSAASNQKRFGRNVRKARKAAGMSLEDLADASGLHFTAVSRLERAEREPRLQTIVVIAAALKVNPGELFDGLKP